MKTAFSDSPSALKGRSLRKPDDIPLIEDQEHYAASYAQQRLWILHHLEGEMSAYNILDTTPYHGELSLPAISEALRQLTARHESLRTTFRLVDGSVRQIVRSCGVSTPQVSYVDLSETGHPQDILEGYLEAEASFIFDLENGPLFRVGLFNTGGGKYLFCLNIHHIIADGWSLRLLLEELHFLYAAASSAGGADLPPLSLQYRHYAAWQRQLYARGASGMAAAFWKRQLVGELPVLALPTDFARPPVRGYRGTDQVIWLDDDLRRQILQLGRQTGSSMFMVLVAALNGLLFRYTGQEDILVGMPMNGREHADLERQIGFYVNTVVCRTRLSGRYSFRVLLRHVRQVMLDTYEYQQYPFDLLVEDLDKAGDRSRNPLFDFMIVYERAEIVSAKDAVLADLPLRPRGKASKFDLMYTFQERKDRLILTINYNTDLFEPQRIRQMARHVREWMTAVISNPDLPIAELDFPADGEKELLLRTLNDVSRPYPAGVTLTQLLEAQAPAHPPAGPSS